MVFEDTAKPEAEPDVGVNNNGWLAFVLAKTTFIFVAVVARPDVVAYPEVFELPDVMAYPD